VSDFAALSIGLTALTAARKGLDVTGQNIANANTDGYTRQRLVQQAVGAPITPALWSTYTGAGSGVQVTGIARLGDEFVTARARIENATLADLTQRQATLAGVENTLGEPSDTGLAGQLTDMWNAWHDVANAPGDLAARSVLLSRTTAVADGIRTVRQGLDALWSGGRQQLDTVVAQVNADAATVAELNQAILRHDNAGEPANELRDQRDSLLADLAARTGATVRYVADGTAEVYLGSSALVRGNTAAEVASTGAAQLSDMRSGAAAGPALVWAGSGGPVSVGGELGARLEGLTGTLPGYVDRLDAVTAALRDAVNAAHSAGYDLDGNPGTTMFAAGATSADIAVQITDPRRVAAAAHPPSGTDASLDGDNAAALGALGRADTGADSAYRQLVVDVGVAAQAANRRHDVQADIAQRADAAVDSAGGVNTDEEMVNLLSYQRAYQAAARVTTAVDEMLDTLINRTGMVGR
jgi:flagellar hook-associated protein 1 FlgK